MEDLESRGQITRNALRFVGYAPVTFIIQVNFKTINVGKLPLDHIIKASKTLCERLQKAMTP